MIVQYAMQKAFNGAEGEMSDRIRLALANFEVCRSWQFGEWWSKYCDLPGQRFMQHYQLMANINAFLRLPRSWVATLQVKLSKFFSTLA